MHQEPFFSTLFPHACPAALHCHVAAVLAEELPLPRGGGPSYISPLGRPQVVAHCEFQGCEIRKGLLDAFAVFRPTRVLKWCDVEESQIRILGIEGRRLFRIERLPRLKEISHTQYEIGGRPRRLECSKGGLTDGQQRGRKQDSERVLHGNHPGEERIGKSSTTSVASRQDRRTEA